MVNIEQAPPPNVKAIQDNNHHHGDILSKLLNIVMITYATKYPEN